MNNYFVYRVDSQLYAVVENKDGSFSVPKSHTQKLFNGLQIEANSPQEAINKAKEWNL